MNSFVLLMCFVLLLIWIPINADNTPVLGISPCMYSGSFDPNPDYKCLKDPMPVTSLPTECTSFIYDGLMCDKNFKFNLSNSDKININELSNSGKKLYLYYNHGSLKSWMQAIDSGTLPDDAEVFNLDSDVIAGLILKDLNYNYDGNLDYHVASDFSSKLKNYVNDVKTKIPGLKIGLYVQASNMIYYSDNSNHPEDWFDFVVLNNVMDFYIIGFDKFNPCGEHFRNGIVPINDICGSSNSLTKLAAALSSSKIAKDQIYVEISANPTSNDIPQVLPTCAVTYQKICEDPKYYKNIMCADNPDSFYDKGKFAKQQLKAVGIIPKYIDTIDPTGACECDSGNKFITFNMMLRGFLQGDRITDCLKLNSITSEKPSCLNYFTMSTINPIVEHIVAGYKQMRTGTISFYHKLFSTQ